MNHNFGVQFSRCRLIQISRRTPKFTALNFWDSVWNFPKKEQDGVEGARWNRNEKIQRRTWIQY